MNIENSVIMWNIIWPALLLTLVVGQNATSNDSLLIHHKNTTSTTTILNVTDKKTDDTPSVELNYINTTETVPMLRRISDKTDELFGNYYYYFLITISSLSVIGIIVFKAMRLKQSRAEIKYGKASIADRSEVEPLERSRWLDDSSDNEDEVFDINFLKNSRTQNAV